jgi:proteasome lid subunit RPN8/RPN11
MTALTTYGADYKHLTGYKVKILDEVYEKIMFWVEKCPVEISGFGKVKFIDGYPTIISAYLVEQVNSSAETEIDAEALAKLMYETREEEGLLNFWWHSHVNMAVNWSGTDYTAMNQLGSNGWILATVFNKKHDQRTAIYQKGDDFHPPIFINDIDLEIIKPIADSTKTAWLTEYTTKCKTKTYNSSWGNKGQKWCPKKRTWVDAETDVGKLKGEQLTLLPEQTTTTTGTASGQDTTTTKELKAQKQTMKAILPTVYDKADGYLALMHMPLATKWKWAEYYKQFIGEYTDEWYDLNDFYDSYRDMDMEIDDLDKDTPTDDVTFLN